MRFAVIDCEDSPKWDPLSFANIVQQAFEKDGDEWQYFALARDCARGKQLCLPSPSASDLRAVVITGSHYNVRDDPPWQAPLIEFIRAIHARPAAAKGPVLLGICYGHQLIAHALGGVVGNNPSGSFTLRSEELTLTPAFAELPEAKGIAALSDDGRYALVPDAVDAVFEGERDHLSLAPAVLGRMKTMAPRIRLLASHGDAVTQLPSGATLLGYSSSCPNEIMACGPSILSFQCHPEFELQSCIMDRIWPSVTGRGRVIDQQGSLATFKAPRHTMLMRALIRSFLEGPSSCVS